MTNGNVILDHDEDGYWAYYPSGRKSGSDPVGAQHSDVADTAKERARMVRESLPCDCSECKQGLVRMNGRSGSKTRQTQ